MTAASTSKSKSNDGKSGNDMTVLMTQQQYDRLCVNAWNALDELDDLSGSTAGMMYLIRWLLENEHRHLLGSVVLDSTRGFSVGVEAEAASSFGKKGKEKVVVSDGGAGGAGRVDSREGLKRVLKFWRHNSRGVRLAALSVSKSLLVHILNSTTPTQQTGHGVDDGDDTMWVRYVSGFCMLNLVVELDDRVIEETKSLWHFLIAQFPTRPHLSRHFLNMITKEGWMHWWMYILTTPLGTCLPTTYLPQSTPSALSLPTLTTHPISHSPAFRQHLDMSKMHEWNRTRKDQASQLAGQMQLSPVDLAVVVQDWDVVESEGVFRARGQGVWACLEGYVGLLKAYGSDGGDGGGGEVEGLQAIMQNLVDGLVGEKGECVSTFWTRILGLFAHFLYEIVLHHDKVDRASDLDSETSLTLRDIVLAKKEKWHVHLDEKLIPMLTDKLVGIVYNDAPFQAPSLVEHKASMHRLYGESLALLNYIVNSGCVDRSLIPALPTPETGFDATMSAKILDTWCPMLISQHVPEAFVRRLEVTKPKDQPTEQKRQATFYQDVQARIQAVQHVLKDTVEQERKLEVEVMASASMGLVKLGTLREGGRKIAPVIKNLMVGVKSESSEFVQPLLANAVADLISILCDGGDVKERQVAQKICMNACAYLYVVPSETVPYTKEWQTVLEGVIGFGDLVVKEAGVPDMHVTRKGGEVVLRVLCERYKDRVFDILPVLSETMTSSLSVEAITPENGQQVIHAMQLLVVLSKHLHPDLLCKNVLDQQSGWITRVYPFIASPLPALRHMASRTLASLAASALQRRLYPVSPMKTFIVGLLPLLSDTTNVHNRLGCAELIWRLIEVLEHEILPYLVFFLVPILGRMSDQHDSVRAVVTRCFSEMVKLLPLENNSSAVPPGDLDEELLNRRQKERAFIIQLLDPSKLEPYEIPVKIHAELRSYQQDGVNWLGFLNKYQLHGILCDDMGLGKTLQTICIVSSDMHTRAVKFQQTQSPDSQPIPSLIVCPTSVTGHWKHEMEKYTDNLKPLLFGGSANERRHLQPLMDRHNVFIVSYEVLRNDLSVFKNYHFNYLVLDEGHIIKNPKTKTTQAVKSIKANHRLILSGTPIQNNVLELWSLFDFLMPGFLGTEKQFSERYSKPILAMKNLGGHSVGKGKGKKKQVNSNKVQEAGTLALEALHRQVLPFLLRRMKEDVLHDLPPKIIQDYYCDMSTVQRHLYEEFAREQLATIESEMDDTGAPKGRHVGGHIFQALQYMRKLCNHPCLVVDPTSQQFQQIQPLLKGRSLDDASHAPKLLALRDLLHQCGIGNSEDNQMSSAGLSQHRVLIFCQLKTMLDMIEHQLFKKHMPEVSYMRMDGSTDARKRQDMVFQFNADPSIDVLLLTTNVGGLGLNLTGADTVIFVEHDWNPMKDLQAMDRAHRLGQKKVVNVYRLITRNTLEEKIMGLQRFKLNVANTIINQENSGGGLKSMESSEILDLFQPGAPDDESSSRKRKFDEEASAANKKLKSMGVPGLSAEILEELDQLANDSQQQYEAAFNPNALFDRYSSKK